MMDNGGRIPTNLRTLLILEAVGLKSDPMSPAEIGREIGLPKQTTHRLCNTLLEEGFLMRDERGARIASGTTRANDGARCCSFFVKPMSRAIRCCKKLASQIGETVNFVVPEDRGMSYQDRVETDWPFRIQLPIGTNVPFHCTASGKTYLASLPKTERRRLVHVMHLEKHTDATITNPDALLSELHDIARQGYAVDRCEFYDGMVAAAVPVLDPTGRYCASLAFHAPEQRVSIDDAMGNVGVLTSTSKKLTDTIFSS